MTDLPVPQPRVESVEGVGVCPAPSTAAIRVMGTRRNNAELVVDLRNLGYLRSTGPTLDATYGLGRFWRLWQPDDLVAADLYADETDRPLNRWDFTQLPCDNQTFDAVVFDPPYKLNGTSTGSGAASSDQSYGVHQPSTWQQRHELIRRGISECGRVAARTLIVKCQDQVCSGRKRWQTREFADHAESVGWRLTDMLHVGGSRPQPAGRRQVHAQQDYSTALVFARSGRAA